MMSPVLPYDIIAQIIDGVGESDDINLIKELALPLWSRPSLENHALPSYDTPALATGAAARRPTVRCCYALGID